jgi:putative MFS transporter
MSSRNDALPAAHERADTQRSIVFTRRFLRKMIFVMTGGMFLDGYILGIVGSSSVRPRSCSSYG